MARSDAATVPEYLAELPPDRRDALSTVRATILDNLPEGYEEAMNWGMIAYQVPLATFPDTHNGQPLMYAAPASQKRHMAVYLASIYMDEDSAADFEEAYRATGKRMDLGRSSVRFRRLDELPLDLVAAVIADTSVAEFLDRYRARRGEDG